MSRRVKTWAPHIIKALMFTDRSRRDLVEKLKVKNVGSISYSLNKLIENQIIKETQCDMHKDCCKSCVEYQKREKKVGRSTKKKRVQKTGPKSVRCLTLNPDKFRDVWELYDTPDKVKILFTPYFKRSYQTLVSQFVEIADQYSNTPVIELSNPQSKMEESIAPFNKIPKLTQEDKEYLINTLQGKDSSFKIAQEARNKGGLDGFLLSNTLQDVSETYNLVEFLIQIITYPQFLVFIFSSFMWEIWIISSVESIDLSISWEIIFNELRKYRKNILFFPKDFKEIINVLTDNEYA